MTQSEAKPLTVLVFKAPIITDVYFSSYYNPFTLNIVVNNPNNIEVEVTVKVYIDNYGTSDPSDNITDTIPAKSDKTLTKNVTDLTTGEHFIYCSL